jgi:hypothetical protein
MAHPEHILETSPATSYSPLLPAATTTVNPWLSLTGQGFDTGGPLTTLPLGAVPGVAETFAGSPAALWQAAAIQRMGSNAALPQFQRTAMQGFTPALGQYMLGGGGGTFADYLTAGGTPTATQATGNWENALMASRMLDPSYQVPSDTPTTGDVFDRMTRQQGYLTGPDARRNALAMAGAQMGGTGGGYAMQAQQRALGNLYDLYAARAAGTGAPAGGFLGYLGDIRGT